MFGHCHWWTIPERHPWRRRIRQIQQALSVFEHVPHVTIRTRALSTYTPPPPPQTLTCGVDVSATRTVSTRGTLWALEIPIDGFERADGEPSHLSVAYRWNQGFSPNEVRIVSNLVRAMARHECTRVAHQEWFCNGPPATWRRVTALIDAVARGDIRHVRLLLRAQQTPPSRAVYDAANGNPQMLYLLDACARRIARERLKCELHF